LQKAKNNSRQIRNVPLEERKGQKGREKKGVNSARFKPFTGYVFLRDIGFPRFNMSQGAA